MRAACLLLALALAGCGCDDKTTATELGTIVSVDMKMGSWNSCDKTVIRTDKTVITVCTAIQVIPLNRPITMVINSCGTKTFYVENGPTIRGRQ